MYVSAYVCISKGEVIVHHLPLLSAPRAEVEALLVPPPAEDDQDEESLRQQQRSEDDQGV